MTWKIMTGALLGGLLFSGAAFSQGAVDCVPSPTNMPNAGYPRVCPDYRVMFKLEAPNARNVQLQPSPGANGNGLGVGPFDMTRGPDGVWSVTIGPVVPGFHYYDFVVDGLHVNDPGSDGYTNSLGLNPSRGLEVSTGGLEVPEKGVDFYLPKDVPHGVVEEVWYKAGTTGEYRRVMVYTPPGYDKSLTTRFPVLYLQHGGANDEQSWTHEGHLADIMNNLLAEKKIVPMLVVMERGYATMTQTSAEQTVPYSLAIYNKSYQQNRDGFDDLMIKDLIPMIDGRYRTVANRDNRALAGLSRGAGQSLEIGLNHLDVFTSIGAFSGSLDDAYKGRIADPAKLNANLKLLWVGAGTAEGGYPGIRAFHQELEKTGIRHVYYEVPGTAHEWATWRRHLVDFAPRLFSRGK